MLKSLEKKQQQLKERKYFWGVFGFCSGVASLITLGFMLGVTVSRCKTKDLLAFSIINFGLNSATLLVSINTFRSTESKLFENSVAINKAKLANKGCWNCAYATGELQLKCAINPVEQPDDCPDKEIEAVTVNF